MRNLRILCVDDDPISLRMLSLFLNKHLPEDHISHCDHPLKASGLQKQHAYDIIITDLVMPDMTGVEFLQEIKSSLAQSEVILITANSSIESVIEAMKSGAMDYLEKPINMNLLLEKIEVVRRNIEKLECVESSEAGLRTIEQQAQATIASLTENLLAQQSAIEEAVAALESTQESAVENAISILKKSLT